MAMYMDMIVHLTHIGALGVCVPRGQDGHMTVCTKTPQHHGFHNVTGQEKYILCTWIVCAIAQLV